MSTPRTSTPTLINLPPPQESMTPSDAPGTPNSTTTSMSELSTVAIKDGHRGHVHHSSQTGPQDAERADRISRLAGLDRVPRATPNPSTVFSSVDTTPARQLRSNDQHYHHQQYPVGGAYFDGNNAPQIVRQRSTVGSASATGSVGGSNADGIDDDKMSMSEDMEVDTSSVGGMSDEGASLVGFGEGARTPARPIGGLASPLPPALTSRGSLKGSFSADSKMEGLNFDKDAMDIGRTPPPTDE